MLQRRLPWRSLRVSSLRIDVAGQPLLADLSVDLRASERIAVAGPSGVGKTTFLRAVAGLIDRVAGAVTLDGRTAGEVGWAAWRRRVTLVTQRPVLFPGSVARNLARPFAYQSVARPFPEEEVGALLARLLLPDDVLDCEASSLSVGEQQRVSLVRALALESEVLLLDEPTSALDPDATREVEALLGERARAGAAMLVVTHDAAQAERLCDSSLDLAAFSARAPQNGVAAHA